MAYKNYNNNKDKYPWTGQRILNGKRQRKSFSTKKDALIWESQGQFKESKTPTVSLHDWATAYLNYASERFVKSTYSEKRVAFAQLFKFLQNLAIQPHRYPSTAVVPQTVYDFLLLQSKIRSGNAANKDRKNLIAAWSWGIKFLGLPADNPFSRVEKFSSERFERHVPTLDDFLKVFETLLD